MIGLNGALVAVLCTAYFTLIATALWDDEPAADRNAAPERDAHARASNLATVVANVLVTSEHDARTRSESRVVNDVVMGLPRREPAKRRRGRRPVQCDRSRVVLTR